MNKLNKIIFLTKQFALLPLFFLSSCEDKITEQEPNFKNASVHMHVPKSTDFDDILYNDFDLANRPYYYAGDDAQYSYKGTYKVKVEFSRPIDGNYYSGSLNYFAPITIIDRVLSKDGRMNQMTECEFKFGGDTLIVDEMSIKNNNEEWLKRARPELNGWNDTNYYNGKSEKDFYLENVEIMKKYIPVKVINPDTKLMNTRNQSAADTAEVDWVNFYNYRKSLQKPQAVK